MISRFFIDRPIFATVISVVITLAGGVAVFTLPVAQYPDVTPPTVQVTASLPGGQRQYAARHRGGADRGAGQRRRGHAVHVLAVHQQRHLYPDGDLSSWARTRTWPRCWCRTASSLALPVVPALVQNEGITVKKQSPNTLLIVNLIGQTATRTIRFISAITRRSSSRTSWPASTALPASATWASATTA